MLTSRFAPTICWSSRAVRARRRRYVQSKLLFRREQAWPSGARLEGLLGHRMKSSEFPLDKADRRLSEVARRSEHSPTVYRYVESPSPENAPAGNYDSLLDYWHILFRHRVTLLKFALGGLLAAIVISLVQTPIYRGRTSLETQNPNSLTMKVSNDYPLLYSPPQPT